MKKKGPDQLAVLAMNTPGGNAQAQEDLLYQNGSSDSGESIAVLKEEVSVACLGPDGKVQTRQARYYYPKTGEKRFPLILSIHYEIPDGDRVLYEYISRGWAVLTPIQIPLEDLMNIVGRDLRLSNAMISMARRNPKVDPLRIALRGCSAGGFQVLLLAALRAGLCAVYSMSGVCNLPYEFGFYIPQSNEYNLAMAHTLMEEQRKDFNNFLLPYVKTVADTFQATRVGLGVEDPLSEPWLRYSPVNHLARITCPILLSHSTADAIVPVYQVTEKHAVPKGGASLPDGYCLHLKEFIGEGAQSLPLDELVELNELHVHHSAAPAGTEGTVLSFDAARKFSLHLIDEGPVERGCSHFKDLMRGLVDDTGFFQTHFHDGSGMSNKITPQKMQWLASRYQGQCELLTEENASRSDADGAVYGSLDAQRLDVVLDLLACVGVNPWVTEADDTGMASGNVVSLEAEYARLSSDNQFLGTSSPFVSNLLCEAERYARACGDRTLADALRARSAATLEKH